MHRAKIEIEADIDEDTWPMAYAHAVQALTNLEFQGVSNTVVISVTQATVTASRRPSPYDEGYDEHAKERDERQRLVAERNRNVHIQADHSSIAAGEVRGHVVVNDPVTGRPNIVIGP